MEIHQYSILLTGDVYIDSNGTVDLGGQLIDLINVLNIDANGDLDVNGHTELDNVAISGITTFTGTIDANGNVDVRWSWH